MVCEDGVRRWCAKMVCEDGVTLLLDAARLVLLPSSVLMHR